MTFWRQPLLIALLIMGLPALEARAADDSLPRYFEFLRRRALFATAEHYALQRLNDDKLSGIVRTQLTCELARTFSDHAVSSNLRQRDELWNQAQTTLGESLNRQPPLPQRDRLRAEAGRLQTTRAGWLKLDALVAPQDIAQRELALTACSDAITSLTALTERLALQLKTGRKQTDDDLPGFEARVLYLSAQGQLGAVYRDRAELRTAPSADRTSDLIDAATAFRQAIPANPDARSVAEAKIGLADCSRLQRDFDKAREMLASIAGSAPPLDADLVDRLDVCRLRCWLDEDQPLEAAQYLIGIRQARPRLSGELWFAQLQTFLALRRVATAKSDQTLANQLTAEGELVLQRIDEQVGGTWSRLARLVVEQDRSQQRLGGDLDALVRRAKAEFLGKRPKESAATYAEAIALAKARSESTLAVQLAKTRGSILIELGDYEIAATELQTLAHSLADPAEAASAQLLAAYALGRFYDQMRTHSRRAAYTQALEHHLEKYPSDVTASDAAFMLAQLEEQRLQASKALPLYRRVPTDHARHLQAAAGIARCDESLVNRLKSLGHDWRPFHQQAVAELARIVDAWPVPAEWSITQADIAVRLTRLLLRGDPPSYRDAQGRIQQLDTAFAVQKPAEDQARWQQLANTVLPLRMVVLAGTGRGGDARKLFASSTSQTPSALLEILSGLEEIAGQGDVPGRVELTELMVETVRRLDSQRDQLSVGDRARFDLGRIRAHLETGRVSQAVRIVNELTSQAPKDFVRQRQYADLLEREPGREAQLAARNCWLRIEKGLPEGSADWMAARVSVIECTLRAGDRADAVKLLSVTTALYPPAEDPRTSERLANLRAQLDTSANE